MRKKSLYLFGLITLLVFPVPTFLILWFAEGISPVEILSFRDLTPMMLFLGFSLGGAYAFLALKIMDLDIFKKLPVRIETIVRNMNLSFIDCILLSICASVGEELLFRSGVQFYLGPAITAILFVTVHGYLNPMNWRMSLYGLLVLPFVFLISYGFIRFGLWFAVAAHFMYDLILFLSMKK